MSEQSQTPTSITLRGQTYDIVMPSSVCLVLDVGAYMGRAPLRAHAAAIGIAVPRVARILRVGTLQAAGYDVAEYGGRMVDALYADGVRAADIMEQGRVCIEALASLLPSEAEVTADADFSEATP